MTVRDFPSDARFEELPAEGRRLVAVVGINGYRHWPKLDNAVRDATRASQVFQQLGFEQVTAPLIDDMATARAMRSLVSELATLGSDDSLVLFFAGHGYTDSVKLQRGPVHTGYIVPVDADPPRGDRSSWIRIDHWLSNVARLPVRHILVILDACRSGIALGSVPRWRDEGAARHGSLDELRRRQSRRVITSALEDQQAMDGGPLDGHSLFTGCLIEALDGGLARDGRREATVTDIGRYVQDRVTSYPGSRQTPDFGTLEHDERGELVIQIGGARVRPRPPSPDRDASGVAATIAPAEPMRNAGAAHDAERRTFAGRTALDWAQDLSSKTAPERRDAAFAIGQLGRAAAGALPALLDALRTNNPSFELVDAIGRVAPDDERVRVPLAGALGAADAGARTRAADLLAEHGSAALGVLLRALDDGSRRSAAGRALAQIGESAVEPLLDLASLPANEERSREIQNILGMMNADARERAVQIARARPGLELLVLRALHASDITLAMGDFALEIWSRHSSPGFDWLAAGVALRSPCDPAALVPVAVAAFRDDDKQLVEHAVEIPFAGPARTALLRQVLELRDAGALQRSLPATVGRNDVEPGCTGVDDASERGTDLVAAWMLLTANGKNAYGRRSPDTEIILSTVLHACPQSASPEMLEYVLRNANDITPRLVEIVCDQLIAAGPAGLGTLLYHIGDLDPLARSTELKKRITLYAKVKAALARAAGSASDVVAAAAVVAASPAPEVLHTRNWKAGTFDFCVHEAAYAAAAAPYAVGLLRDPLHARNDSHTTQVGCAARRVLEVAPEASLQAVIRGPTVGGALDSSVLQIIIAKLPQQRATFLQLVPLLEDGAVADRVFEVLRKIPPGIWYDAAARAQTVAALDRVRGASAMAKARQLRWHVLRAHQPTDREPEAGRRRRTGGVSSFGFVAVVSALGGLLLLPLGLDRIRRRVVISLGAVVVAVGVTLWRGEEFHRWDPGRSAFGWLSLLALVNAVIAIMVASASRVVCDAASDEPGPTVLGKIAIGVSTGVPSSLVVSACFPVSAIGLRATLAVIAGVLGIAFAALDGSPLSRCRELLSSWRRDRRGYALPRPLGHERRLGATSADANRSPDGKPGHGPSA